MLVPAVKFTIQQLTNIYNESRVDYLVPMPMSRAKLQEYINVYDVDLKNSAVAVLNGKPVGLAMLGVRDDTTWLTRLGIAPDGRRKGIGQRMMSFLIDRSRATRATAVTLEVIKNNLPARHLFESLGFIPTRELLVIRRAPAQIETPSIRDCHVEPLGYNAACELLKTRTDNPSWLMANESLLNAGNLSALVAYLPDGGQGWLVYQNTVFQLSRLVLETQCGNPVAVATCLLENLHGQHPVQDTVVENLVSGDEHWPVFKALGYMISFERVEMKLDLNPTITPGNRRKASARRNPRVQ